MMVTMSDGFVGMPQYMTTYTPLEETSNSTSAMISLHIPPHIPQVPTFMTPMLTLGITMMPTPRLRHPTHNTSFHQQDDSLPVQDEVVPLMLLDEDGDDGEGESLSWRMVAP